MRRQVLASIRRPIPQPEREETYAQDKEKSVTTQIEQNENASNGQPSSQSTEGDTYDSPKTIFLDDFPTSLNSIKEYVAEKDGSTYILLHSTIPLKKRRRMLYLPLEFDEITMDGFVDSGAFINAMSWSDYNAIKMNSENCIIKEYPQLPFKIECANAQLEQPIATADIQFNIGTYTFMDTFVILSKTSFPIIGLNFMRNHQAVLDTTNGTINFPHVDMTFAMTDEKKLQPETTPKNGRGKPNSTATTNNNGQRNSDNYKRKRRHWDGTASAAIRRDSYYHRCASVSDTSQKRINIRIANLTEFPHTIKNHTKLAELQILKPEETKQIRPIDAAALKLLQDPDDTHMYVNEFMKSSENEQSGENFWFPTPENPGNEEKHTPIQRRILKEIRELIKKEKLDPTKDQESRKKFLDMLKWEGSQIERNDKNSSNKQ